MSNPSTVDREFFQQVLASAFAVQQNQMDSQSLSAIVEAGRLVKSGELDVDGAMHLIVEHTRKAANTTGVAMGPLFGTQLPLPGLEEGDRRSGTYLSQLASTLSEHSAVSADTALDVALHDIAEQARLATKAGAAAIALMRGEEMVCSASTGISAPDVGVFLNARAGLSGDCIQTRRAQCCGDTEADSRVDAVECRHIGIRSFLVCPVLKEGEVVGLFEIFSPRPKAFGDRDIQTLQALSLQILIDITRAVRFSTPLPRDGLPSATDSMDACFASFRVRTPEVSTTQFRLRDPWMLLLVILAIALALLLSRMLGRVNWRGTAHPKGPPIWVTAKLDAAPAQPEQARKADPSPPLPFPPKSRSLETASDSLVVYQDDGRIIFRLKSPKARGESAAPPAPGSPRKTNARLLQLVAPEYPEVAKQQHIQGSVVLEAEVGKDGAVEQLTVISGHSMLATAASDAVLKWRFKPIMQNGRAVPFQTRVNVHFVLP